MQELLLQILTYLRGIWRYRWTFLVTAGLVSSVGWTAVAFLPDQYEVSARVFVDTRSVLKPLLRGLAISTGEQHRISLMTKTLLSRPNMEKLARMTDLDLTAKTPKAMDELIKDLTGRIRFGGTSRENLYTIGFEDESPDLAKLVVKSLLTIFVEGNLGETRKEQDSAQQFLEREIKEYEQRMIEAEARVKRFKQKNLGFLSDQGNYYQRLQAAGGQLKTAELDLKIARQRRTELASQLEDLEGDESLIPMDPGLMNVPMSETDVRIQNMKVQLDDLLLRYTERHPDVVALNRTIDRLEEQRDAELDAATEGEEGAAPGMGANPMYQQMRLVLSEAEAQVAAKEAVVEEYKNRVDELAKAVDRVLQVEAEQAQLNRDYDVLKKNHGQLLARLESARLSRQVDTQADTVQFRVIDPPRVPTKPTGPNRILFSSGVLLAGLALGLALAFLLSQIRPTFDDRRILSEITGIPVLGSVNMVWTEAQKHKRRIANLAYSFGFFGLLSVYGVVVAIYILELDLTSKVRGLIS